MIHSGKSFGIRKGELCLWNRFIFHPLRPSGMRILSPPPPGRMLCVPQKCWPARLSVWQGMTFPAGYAAAAEKLLPAAIRISFPLCDRRTETGICAVDQIRELAADAQVLPNEAERKVYIIEEAELMNLNAQNAALKLLEEPPATVIFVLCAVNSNQLLETVRSRCLTLSVAGGEEAADEDSRKLADGFLTAVRSGDRIRLYRWLAKNELNKIDLTTDFIEASLQRTADMLCGRASCGNLTPEQQMQLYRLLSQCADYLKVNVNPKHIFSLLAAGALESSVPPHSGLSETGESE